MRAFLTRGDSRTDPVGPGYRWVVLSNTTVAMLMATLNLSSVLIALPSIFRGIHLDRLQQGNFNYLLWMLMGYMLITAVVVVNFGRLGDMFGRVRVYNMGFLIFTLAAVGLSIAPGRGGGAALTLIVPRMVRMIFGLTSRVPGAMLHGLTANGIPVAKATTLAHLPAVSYLFAAFLGYNPIGSLLGTKVLSSLSAAHRATLTSRSFFPQLISGPFKHGLVIILSFSIVMCLLAAWASWLRGGKFIYHEHGEPPTGSELNLSAADRSAHAHP